MTVEQVADALKGIRIGAVLLTDNERLYLARIIVERVKCQCGGLDGPRKVG